MKLFYLTNNNFISDMVVVGVEIEAEDVGMLNIYQEEEFMEEQIEVVMVDMEEEVTMNDEYYGGTGGGGEPM